MLDTMCALGFAQQNIGGDFSWNIKKNRRTTVRAGRPGFLKALGSYFRVE